MNFLENKAVDFQPVDHNRKLIGLTGPTSQRLGGLFDR